MENTTTSKRRKKMRIKIVSKYNQRFQCVNCGNEFDGGDGGLSIRVFPTKGGDILMGICKPCIDSGDVCIEQVFDETDKIMALKFPPA